MGIGSVSSLSPDSAAPSSADDFNYARAVDEISKAVDPRVPDETFAKEHGDVSKAQFVVNSFHRLEQWEQANPQKHVGSDIADKLVNLLPEPTVDAWLLEASRRSETPAVGLHAKDGQSYGTPKYEHLGELVHLLKIETLSQKIDHSLEMIDSKSEYAYELHFELHDLMKKSGSERNDLFHSQSLTEIFSAEDRLPRAADFQHWHVREMTPSAAIEHLSKTPDGFGRAMRAMDSSYMYSLFKEWGAEPTTRFLLDERSIDAIGKLPPEKRHEFGLTLQDHYNDIVQHAPNVDKLWSLAQALYPAGERTKLVDHAFAAARAHDTLQTRSDAAFALVVNSIKEGKERRYYWGDIEPLAKDVSPQMVMRAIASSDLYRQQQLAIDLPYKIFAEQWQPAQMAQLYRMPEFKKAVAGINDAETSDYMTDKLFAFVKPLLRSGMSIESVLKTFAPGKDGDNTFQLLEIAEQAYDRPLHDREVLAGAWMEDLPSEPAKREQRFLQAAHWLNWQSFEGRPQLLKSMVSHLSNGRDAFELTWAAEHVISGDAERAQTVAQSISRNNPRANAEMSKLQAELAIDAPYPAR